MNSCVFLLRKLPLAKYTISRNLSPLSTLDNFLYVLLNIFVKGGRDVGP